MDILLATFNGASFLPDQLQSISRQTHHAWHLTARDDGSSDGTTEILARFRKLHEGKVTLIDDGTVRLGAKDNFQRIIGVSKAKYVLLCDQDDVWLETKIQKLVALADAHAKAGQPLLVHSDLQVVDSSLRRLGPSLWKYQMIEPANCGWSRLLVQNVVTGCACLINAELREAAIPIPNAAIMHDWWLALVASISGNIVWTDEALTLYRQHGGNDTGAKHWSLRNVPELAVRFSKRADFRQKVELYQKQALALADHQRGKAPDNIVEALRNFGRIDSMPYWKRVRFLLQKRILKTGMLRNIALVGRI